MTATVDTLRTLVTAPTREASRILGRPILKNKRPTAALLQ